MSVPAPFGGRHPLVSLRLLVLTLGIDLATQNSATAACRIRWDSGRALVEMIPAGPKGEDNGWLTTAMASTLDVDGWVGIDAPFGWPANMVDAVHRYAAGEPWSAPDKQLFRYRLTDRTLQGLEFGIRPFSVSADKIAMTTWRCASLIQQSRPGAQFVRRSGEDRLVEVYPGAALKVWGFVERDKYKGPAKKAQRELLVRELESRATGWLEWIGEGRVAAVASDHALDAVLSALVARAAATGRTSWPEPPQADLAALEGWIHLPDAGCFAELAK